MIPARNFILVRVIPVTVLERHELVLVRLSYWYDFRTGTTFISVRLSYRYDFHTGTTFLPVRLSYWYDFHTGTTFILVRLSYWYDFHTGTTFKPVRLSYLYDFHTGTTFIPVRDLTCKQLTPATVIGQIYILRLGRELNPRCLDQRCL